MKTKQCAGLYTVTLYFSPPAIQQIDARYIYSDSNPSNPERFTQQMEDKVCFPKNAKQNHLLLSNSLPEWQYCYIYSLACSLSGTTPLAAPQRRQECHSCCKGDEHPLDPKDTRRKTIQRSKHRDRLNQTYSWDRSNLKN